MGRNKMRAFFVVCLSIAVVIVSGCDERVRKKFIRTKNDDKKKDNMDVVYQPVDYSSDYFDAAEQYEHHFHLWKAWHLDLKEAVDDNESTKRKKYLLDHEVDALRSMQYWIVPEKQKDFDEMIASLMKIDAELKKPENLQNSQLMSRNLDIIQSKIQGEYDLGHVKDSLIKKR